MRLLILDDEELVGAFIAATAEGMGYEVAATSTVEAFEQSLHRSSPDDIVLDLQLGPQDGITILRFLADLKCPARITLVSGTDRRTLDAARQLAVGLGLSVGAALLKPIRADALRRALAPSERVPAPPSQKELAAGIGNGELLLEYQPIIDCRSGALAGFEALARWARPNKTRVPPDAFIPLAEADPDLMDRLTFAVASRAALDWPLISGQGSTGYVALNVSAQNLKRLDFPERLAAVLEQDGLPPSHVKLEVTETAAMTNPLVQFDVLLRLRLKGFALAIDDFGTGYSSLSMLRQLPYTELKIDRSFVTDMRTSPDSMAMVKAVLALARSMDLETVAEGVEDDETLAILTSLGVTRAQGYGIGRPMEPGKTMEWTSSRRRNAIGDRNRAAPDRLGGASGC